MVFYPFLWIHPHPAARWALLLLALGIFTEAVFVVTVGRGSWLHEHRMRLRWVIPFSAPAVLTVVVAAYFIGLFSPVIGFFGVGVHVLAQGPSRRVATYLYLAVALSYGGFMFAIALGLIADLGLLRPAMDRDLALCVAASTQVMYVAAFVFGRSLGRSIEREILGKTGG
jgi:hypothetical protein